MTQQDRPEREPTAEHKRLAAFLGKWDVEGQQKEGPFGAAARIAAVQTYEWMPGGFFMILRFEGKVGDTLAACVELTGYDSAKRSYPTHTFYNDGKVMEWRLHERNGTWTRTGAWQQHGKTMELRCTTLFNEAGDAMTAKWEFSNNGAAWQTFWDVRATRVKK